MYFETTRPQKVRTALEYLERVNPLYYDVLIRDGDINQDLFVVGNNLTDNDIDFNVESDNELECTNYPLSTNRHADDESLVINNENLLELALGEDRETMHILFDEKCEELAFQKVFFKGKFGYTFPREHYFNINKIFQSASSKLFTKICLK